MSETQVAPQSAASTEEKKPVPGNIVSRGPSAPVQFTVPGQQQTSPADTGGEAGGAAAGAAELTEEQKTAAAEAEKNKLPELSDEQLKELLKGKGIELDDKGFEGLKEKLNPAAAAAAPEDVEAEKVKAEGAFEKRMLDFYIANGGTAEQFVAFKQVAATDLKALSESQIRSELKEANFTDEEITAVMVERYYQINPEELVRDEDKETEEEFLKRKSQIEKKIAFGSKKLETKGSYTKKQAEGALNTLREAVKLEDLQKEEESKHSKRVEEFFTKLPRKIKFELGKAGENGPDLPPIEYEINDADIASVHDVLKDPVKRKQFLYNEDNSLNLDNVASVMLRNKYLESALKDAYLKGDDLGSKREVEKFEKVFPGRTAKDIGVGGATGGNQNARKGHIVSRGAPEPVRR